jgi:ATP-dependent RNA helicase DHX57
MPSPFCTTTEHISAPTFPRLRLFDCGWHRYDPSSNMAALVETWASQGNAVQRRGRAGRIQPGRCFHLVTRRKFESLAPNQRPEIQRVPLDQLCLHIKLLPGLAAIATDSISTVSGSTKRASLFEGIMAVLARLIEPPRTKTVLSAKSTLTAINAFTEHEDLTPLGHHLARLPVDCRLGKLLVLGSMLGALDSACTLAACLESYCPFFSRAEQRDEAETAKRAWAYQASDHLTLLSVYNAWTRLAGSLAKQKKFCSDNLLSHSTLCAIRDSKMKFAALLSDIGFGGVGDLSVKTIAMAARQHAKQTGEWSDGVRVAIGPELNRNDSTKLLKALLCAALLPNLATASETTPPQMSTRKDGPVAFHSSTVNASLLRAPTPYFV